MGSPWDPAESSSASTAWKRSLKKNLNSFRPSVDSTYLKTARIMLSCRGRFSPLGVKNNRADAKWDGRTRLARLNSLARAGTGTFIFPGQLTTSKIGRLMSNLLDWQPYPVDPYSAKCDDHTYTYCV